MTDDPDKPKEPTIPVVAAYNDAVAMKVYQSVRGAEPNATPAQPQQAQPAAPASAVVVPPSQPGFLSRFADSIGDAYHAVKQKAGLEAATPAPQGRMTFVFRDGHTETTVNGHTTTNHVNTVQAHPEVLKAGHSMTNAAITHVTGNVTQNDVHKQTVGVSTNASPTKSK